MKLLIIDPEDALPWEQRYASDNLIEAAIAERRSGKTVWESVQPVPLLESPDDLRKYGPFILYNGHHRRDAAKVAGLFLPGYVLQDDDDIKALSGLHEELLVYDLGLSFERNRDFIFSRAREYREENLRDRRRPTGFWVVP